MIRFFNNLRIGEKIGLSFGLVCLLFLGVIWQYQTTLKQSLSDYQRLLDVFAARKSLALNIERFMLEARRAEKDFLLHRKKAAIGRITLYIGRVREESVKLKQIDAQALVVGEQISEFMKTYHTRFEAIAAAWRKKGLDHNSGLQGRFRDSAHNLEDLSNEYSMPELEKNILQLRRREKDYLLRHDTKYVEMDLELVQTIRSQAAQSGIATENKQKLYALLDVYQNDFLALVAQDDIINRLIVEMNDDADKITQMVERNVETADRKMRETTKSITASSQADSNWMLMIAFAALMLGVSFATFITQYITRALHRIGTVLSMMAHSDPTELLSVTGGRDEFDAMAAAVNTMSDHMERLIAWSMTTTCEDEAHLRSVIYSIPPGVFVTDKDGVIESINPELAAMFEYPPEELIGESLCKLFTATQGPNQFQSLLDKIESHDTQNIDAGRKVTGLSKESKKIPLALIVGKMGQRGKQCYIGLVSDITLQRQAEADWYQAMDEKQELLTSMSHYIDTLMDGIISMVDDQAKTRHAGKRRRYAEIIRQSAQWLRDIMDVILGYSDIIQTHLAPPEETDFDLYLLMDNLSIFFSNFAYIKGIAYRVRRSANLPQAVYGDSGILSRALVNLLSNAIKFTEAGEVVLGAELMAEDETDYQVRFTIQDTGAGIDSSILEHIFEPLDRDTDVDTFEYKRPSRRLVITKQLIELLGGAIEVSSQPGHGAVFTVNLPLKKV